MTCINDFLKSRMTQRFHCTQSMFVWRLDQCYLWSLKAHFEFLKNTLLTFFDFPKTEYFFHHYAEQTELQRNLIKLVTFFFYTNQRQVFSWQSATVQFDPTDFLCFDL